MCIKFGNPQTLYTNVFMWYKSMGGGKAQAAFWLQNKRCDGLNPHRINGLTKKSVPPNGDMINQFLNKSNIDMLYFCIIEKFSSITEIYNKVLALVLSNRVVRIGCPKCGSLCMDFTLHGYYSRGVIDLVPCLDEKGNILLDNDGNVVFKDHLQKEDRISLNVARIKCKEDGSTHALLFNLVVPYKQYSIRYIVYQLYQMIHSGESVEAWCNKHGVSEKNMYKWVKWLEEKIPLLQQLGLIPEMDQINDSDNPGEKGHEDESVNSNVKNRSYLGTVIQWIYTHTEQFYRAALKLFNRVIFQEHKSPPNTVHQFAEI